MVPNQGSNAPPLIVSSQTAAAASPTLPAGKKATRTRLYRMMARPATLAGVILILVLMSVALFAPLFSRYDPVAMSMSERLQPPSLAHLFGTDEFGRDLFVRVIYGARISFGVAVVSVAVATLSGVPIGAVSAYRGGNIDFVVQRFIDVMLAFPGILLAMTIVAILGTSMPNLMIAVGLGSMPFFARLVRGSVLKVKHEDFVIAARALGASEGRIVARHIIPNVLAPIVVLISQQVGWSILSAAALSFVGLGAQPPTPEWGAMLSAGRDYLHEQWWIATFPGLAIVVMVLGFNLVGDGLRDIFDPTLT